MLHTYIFMQHDSADVAAANESSEQPAACKILSLLNISVPRHTGTEAFRAHRTSVQPAMTGLLKHVTTAVTYNDDWAALTLPMSFAIVSGLSDTLPVSARLSGRCLVSRTISVTRRSCRDSLVDWARAYVMASFTYTTHCHTLSRSVSVIHTLSTLSHIVTLSHSLTGQPVPLSSTKACRQQPRRNTPEP